MRGLSSISEKGMLETWENSLRQVKGVCGQMREVSWTREKSMLDKCENCVGQVRELCWTSARIVLDE